MKEDTVHAKGAVVMVGAKALTERLIDPEMMAVIEYSPQLIFLPPVDSG